jgi:hypothetical protein
MNYSFENGCHLAVRMLIGAFLLLGFICVRENGVTLFRQQPNCGNPLNGIK